MSVRHLALTFAAIGLCSLPGCLVDSKSSSPFMPVSGKITYRGTPVKRGTINLMPIAPDGTSATGDIVDGSITDVTSWTRGDGAKVGDYKVTIIAFDDAYLHESLKRGPAGPDPKDVRDLVEKVKGKNPIPLHYGNVATSGLRARINSDGNDLRYDLKDQ